MSWQMALYLQAAPFLLDSSMYLLTDYPWPLTLAACAPTEWSRRRNVVGVAVPALVNTLSVKMALKVYFGC